MCSIFVQVSLYGLSACPIDNVKLNLLKLFYCSIFFWFLLFITWEIGYAASMITHYYITNFLGNLHSGCLSAANAYTCFCIRVYVDMNDSKSYFGKFLSYVTCHTTPYWDLYLEGNQITSSIVEQPAKICSSIGQLSAQKKKLKKCLQWHRAFKWNMFPLNWEQIFCSVQTRRSELCGERVTSIENPQSILLHTVLEAVFSIFLVTHFVSRNYRILHISICKV